MLGDRERHARAAAELGERCIDRRRGAAFYEEAALLLTALDQPDEAEAAFEKSFAKDASRGVAFDKLFRRVRERKDGDKLLFLITRRLERTDDPTELGKLFWEQARVLREKGDHEGALKALENVTMIEPEHVGALALTGEIFIRRGMYEEAATNLSTLALIEDAPPKNRLTAGIAAVDLYENKLDRYDRALEVLLALHHAKLSTLPVRERLARAAARTGSWLEATSILEELMKERPESQGRIEAARLAMAIFRDRLSDPRGAVNAVLRILDEAPSDADAIDALLELDNVDATTKERLFARGRDHILATLRSNPPDMSIARRLTKIAHAMKDLEVEQIALSTTIALSGSDPTSDLALMQMIARKPRFPQVALSPATFAALLAPGDDGPVAQLFALLAPTIAEALGPALGGLGVSKKDRVEAKSGLTVRNEIAAWASAFGIQEFELYIGGRDPYGVQGVPGESPALVIGSSINAPLTPVFRGRLARELFALVRGTTVLRSRDDMTIAAIVVAACHLGEVQIQSPPYPVLAEVEKGLSKAIARKTKKALAEICRNVVASGQDARVWSRRALASHARATLVASGDLASALADTVGETPERLRTMLKSDERALELTQFAFTPAYLELRRALGLEGAT
jgi:tetratricopeptide (TPR) repeat protein